MNFSRIDLINALIFAQDNEEKEFFDLLDIYHNGIKDDYYQFRTVFHITNKNLVEYISAHN